MRQEGTPSKESMSSKEYIRSVHRLGRIGAGIAIIIMFLIPTIIGVFYNAMPSAKQIVMASLPLLVIFAPISISEVISYTPVLGSSIYLTLITGNILNLKLPVATNAMKILNLEYGTEKADVISSIAISVSSIVTIIIIALGVVLMIPLTPILENPAVGTATKYVLPALFGPLALGAFTNNLGGGVMAYGRFKGIVVPAILVVVITLLDKYVLKLHIMTAFQGVVILLMLPLTYFGTKMLYDKGQINVVLPEKK